MPARTLRGAIVGAATLLGKELAEELNSAATAVAWDLTLLDTPESSVQITSAGDEALLIQPVSAEAFASMDTVFFAGEAETALEFWEAAHAAGASIVDLTGALEGKPQVLVRSVFVEGGTTPDMTTIALVPAHPVAIMLSLANTKLRALGLTAMAATVLLPASEMGAAGIEEMHQQTVGLFSFKPLKKEIYDAQVAFNVVASLGQDAKVDLDAVKQKVDRHVGVIGSGSANDLLAVQMLQAPVFHGFTASVFVELTAGTSLKAVRQALQGGVVQLSEDEAPSNESVSGKGDVLLRVTVAKSHGGSAFWLWMAADNLRFAARNAAACALELLALRPAGRVN